MAPAFGSCWLVEIDCLCVFFFLFFFRITVNGIGKSGLLTVDGVVCRRLPCRLALRRTCRCVLQACVRAV